MLRLLKTTLSAVITLLCMSSMVMALGIETPLAEPALEKRAKALFHTIRCVVCQGESIADSPSEIAGDMRKAIRAKIEAGDSNDAIVGDLVSHYGQVVLMKPPFNPATYLLWFGPLLILLYALRLARDFFRQAQPQIPK